MRTWAVISLLTLLLAGCADEPPEATAVVPEPTSSAPPMETPALPPTPFPTPFTWSGHTKEGVWVCMEQDGAGQCPAGSQVLPDGQHVHLLPYSGDVTALDLTMSWQADPTQPGLVLAVYGNTTGGRGPVALVQGPSPLALQLDAGDLGLVPDNALVLMAWPQGKTPTSPSLFVDVTQQSFTVEGTVWTLPAPAED